MIELNSKISRVAFAAITSVIVEFAWYNVGRVASWLGLPRHTVIYYTAKDLLMVILIALILCVVMKPGKIFSFLGLGSKYTKGQLVALIAVLPLYLVFPIIGSVNPDWSFSLLAKGCVLPGFIEEFIWRGFMFGLFFRYAKVGFFWATLLPAILFAYPHIYQGHDFMSCMAAVGVTFIGALYFSWMYTAWKFDLWVPVFLHILMNGAWIIFNVTGTEVAAGGLISNILRIVSIALAIGLTVYFHRKNGSKVFDYPIWRF